jgi:uncharacterized Tic20 family protein
MKIPCRYPYNPKWKHIGLILLPGLAMLGLVIFDVVMVVMAAMKANAGERHRYPYSLRLIT